MSGTGKYHIAVNVCIYTFLFLTRCDMTVWPRQSVFWVAFPTPWTYNQLQMMWYHLITSTIYKNSSVTPRKTGKWSNHTCNLNLLCTENCSSGIFLISICRLRFICLRSVDQGFRTPASPSWCSCSKPLSSWITGPRHNYQLLEY